MFTWLLVLFEIAILAGAFWYVYVREPKRITRVKSNIWGKYAHTDKNDRVVYLLFCDRFRNGMMVEDDNKLESNGSSASNVIRFPDPNETPRRSA